MTLVSRHYAVLTAIRDTLDADADLTGLNPTIRKKAYNRGSSWDPGLWVVPYSRTEKPHENVTDESSFDCAVIYASPEDQDLTSNLEQHLGVSERVMAIFKNKAGSQAPYLLRQLDSELASEGQTKFERSDAKQGPQFPDEAFRSGYDVSAVIVTVTLIFLRYNSSQLGAPSP